jgi:hypothetical protein
VPASSASGIGVPSRKVLSPKNGWPTWQGRPLSRGLELERSVALCDGVLRCVRSVLRVLLLLRMRRNAPRSYSSIVLPTFPESKHLLAAKCRALPQSASDPDLAVARRRVAHVRIDTPARRQAGSQPPSRLGVSKPTDQPPPSSLA